jgi:hypothetical protein
MVKMLSQRSHQNLGCARMHGWKTRDLAGGLAVSHRRGYQEAYLLDKHPDWVWMKPRLASEEEVCGCIAQNIWSGYGNLSILTPILPTIRALKNTPGVPPERPSVQSI